MSRDGRGNPGRYVPKNLPRLRLTDLLRRRKMTLRQFIDELGLTTWSALQLRCERMGIVEPTQAEFDVAMPPINRVNSPQEGVIVLEAPRVTDELTGRSIDPEAPVEEPSVMVTADPFVPPIANHDQLLPSFEPTEGAQKKSRKKKESTQDE